ncbi:hypothetical protein [Chryseobacterium sp.]|nr:hypothetical protein [Chryseobacterium sp.]
MIDNQIITIQSLIGNTSVYHQYDMRIHIQQMVLKDHEISQ